jgi:predicted DNA-binding WGR domain protein
MPAELAVGAPPPLPGSVEAPTNMPGPRDVPGGNVTDAAAPPGLVPPGDSRSLRKGNEFALIYRQGTAVITRFGTIGQRGQWRVVEYPTPASASNSYAKEVSRYVGDGFTDYRD